MREGRRLFAGCMIERRVKMVNAATVITVGAHPVVTHSGC